MREILFRGKRKDNGEWIEGSLIIISKRYFIANSIISTLTDEYRVISSDKSQSGYFNNLRRIVEVIPETVGQYTGLTDKNGKKIFEGDIVKIELRDKSFVNTSVYFMNGYFKHSFNTYLGNLVTVAGRCEIIGNTTDNPELLKGGAE